MFWLLISIHSYLILLEKGIVMGQNLMMETVESCLSHYNQEAKSKKAARVR